MTRTVNRALQLQLEHEPVTEQAAGWFAELQGSDISLERVTEWQRWLSSDECHRIAYGEIESLWAAVPSPAPRDWPSPRAVAADQFDAGMSVSQWRAQHSRSRLRYALAASIVTAAVLIGWQLPAIHNWLSPSSTEVFTVVGEVRALRLSDGSTISIGGRSMVSADLEGRARRIVLQEGEIFLDVSKDPARPFTVQAGETTISVLGTQFNVRRGVAGVVVSVAQGLVQVEQSDGQTLRLTAGEQLRLDSDGRLQSRQTLDASAVGGWREGRLLYLDEPLSSVITDVRRYVDKDIEISDPAVGQLRITGTVFANDIDSWLRTLEAAFPLEVKATGSGAIRLVASP